MLLRTSLILMWYLLIHSWRQEQIRSYSVDPGGNERHQGECVSQCTLLLLLSRFSRVRLCATPQMAAHQALPSLGFSRQEHWSGLPFSSPVHESEK